MVSDRARLREGGYINKSLLALINVISRITNGQARKHIPFRDSKLTRILQPSLSGKARLVMIFNVNQTGTFFEETRNTLKLASRAGHLTIRSQVSVRQNGAMPFSSS